MEINEKLDLIIKNQELIIKMHKDLTKNVKLALKAMHLIPATEAELKKLQILQRDNFNKAAKVNEELDDMRQENKPESNMFENLNLKNIEVYGDILGMDILGGED